MTGARPALGVVLALAACGRLGFEDRAGDAGDPGETITLVVTSDEYLSDPAGMPIVDATVLIDRGTGVLERVLTDDSGTAQFPSSGVVAYHVVYLADLGWRIYTAQTPPPGTFELGGRPAVNLNRSMTITTPTSPGNGLYSLHLPAQCAIPSSESAPVFTFSFDPACEGRSVRAIAFRRDGIGTTATATYLDAGSVALVNGSTHDATGSYKPTAAVTLDVSNLPDLVTEVAGDVVVREGGDLTSLVGTGFGAFPQSGSATMMKTVASGGNAIRMTLYMDLGGGYGASVDHLRPQTIAATMAVDAAALLPPFTSLTIDLPFVSWAGGSTGGSWIAVEAITGMVQWNAYAPPSATFVRFPAIPADLGVPVPTAFDVVLVNKLDLPGATAEELSSRFDRTWRDWPASLELLPAEGITRAQISYLAP
jgi:hypothetical protein